MLASLLFLDLLFSFSFQTFIFLSFFVVFKIDKSVNKNILFIYSFSPSSSCSFCIYLFSLSLLISFFILFFLTHAIFTSSPFLHYLISLLLSLVCVFFFLFSCQVSFLCTWIFSSLFLYPFKIAFFHPTFSFFFLCSLFLFLEHFSLFSVCCVFLWKFGMTAICLNLALFTLPVEYVIWSGRRSPGVVITTYWCLHTLIICQSHIFFCSTFSLTQLLFCWFCCCYCCCCLA